MSLLLLFNGSIRIERTITDSFSVIDNLVSESGLAKAISDFITVSEQVMSVIDKRLTDVSIITDLIILREYGKAVNDIITTRDVLSRNAVISRTVEDIVSIYAGIVNERFDSESDITVHFNSGSVIMSRKEAVSLLEAKISAISASEIILNSNSRITTKYE